MVTQELGPSWAKSTGTSLGWTLISALLIAIAYFLPYTVNYFGHPQLGDRESVCSIPHFRSSREDEYKLWLQ